MTGQNRSSRYTGISRDIECRNVNIHKCEECGRDLAYREYIEATDLCFSCKRKAYSRGQHTYKLRGGSNDIDAILINKMEEKN